MLTSSIPYKRAACIVPVYSLHPLHMNVSPITNLVQVQDCPFSLLQDWTHYIPFIWPPINLEKCLESRAKRICFLGEKGSQKRFKNSV